MGAIYFFRDFPQDKGHGVQKNFNVRCALVFQRLY